MAHAAKQRDETSHLFSCRFSSETPIEKKILLQGIESSLSLSILQAAFQNGWTVAIIREDANSDHLHYVLSEWAPHFYFAGDQHDDSISVHSNRTQEPLDVWMSGKQSKPQSPSYSWMEDECAVILFTSGSTGMPRGVCHSLGNLIRSAKLFASHFEMGDGDHLCCLAPIHTMSGMRSLVLPLVCPAQVSILNVGSTTFLSIINRIGQLQPTKIICGPVFIRQLAAYGDRLASHLQRVQALLCTGADLDETDRECVTRILGIPVVNYYGLTETSGIVLAETMHVQHRHCLPPPCQGVQISLIEVENSNRVFRLRISGPNIFLGYLGEPLFRKEIFDTGDLIQKTRDGKLTLAGRSSGAAKASNTEWIFPDLLENWMKGKAGISDAVVKTCRVSGGFGIEVWVDCSTHSNISEMEESIVQHFGPEYRPVYWHKAKIKRNSLGKVDQIIED